MITALRRLFGRPRPDRAVLGGQPQLQELLENYDERSMITNGASFVVAPEWPGRAGELIVHG